MKTALTRRPLQILSASIATALASLLTAESLAQSTLFTYAFGDVVSGTSGTTSAGGVANNVTFGSFTAVGTQGQPNAGGRFSFIDWSLGATNGSDSFTGVIDLAQYYEVTLTPDVGFSLDLDNISFVLQRSSTGIRQYSVRSSIDGFASNLAASISPANASLSVVNAPQTNIFQVTDAATGANSGSLVTLGGLFDAITTAVTFRFYGWNAEQSGGTFSLDNVAFTGLTASAAGPQYWDTNGTTVGLGGSGTWNVGNSTWTASTTGEGPMAAFASANPVVFSGAAGIVSVDAGGVTATAGLKFETDGYEIKDGTLTLNTVSTVNTAHAAGTTTTINSVIAGNAGLTKSGGGTLVLGGTNIFTGPVAINAGAVAISAETNLGDSSNDITFNGGKLVVTENVNFSADRDLSGSTVLEVQAGKTLAVAGNSNIGGLALGGTGTVTLDGSARSVGAISFTDAGTLSSTAGAITATTITTTHTAGTATITADLNLGSATRTVTVADGADDFDLILDGALSIGGGANNRLHKLGAGTLRLSGDNSGLTGSLRIGNAGGTPAAGGTVVITNKFSLGSDPSLAIQFNDGVICATQPLDGAEAIPLGLSIGAGQGVPATFAGADMQFNGNVTLFKPSSFTHNIRVENTTTFSGSFNSSTGSTSNGLTISGPGALILSNTSNSVTEAITVDGPTFVVNGKLTAASATVNVLLGTLTGGGEITGDVTLQAGSLLAPGDGTGTLTLGAGLNLTAAVAATDSASLVFELGATSDSVILFGGPGLGLLTVTNGTLEFGDFAFTPGAGFDQGTYVLFDTANVLDPAMFGTTLSGEINGLEATLALSGDGTDIVLTVPEPSAAVFLLGGVALLARRRHRRA